MIDQWIASSLSLAAAESPGMAATLLAQIWLWVKVAIGIGLVIFVHELGHFLAAKWFGVKCEKFYVGFDVPLRIGPIKFPRTLGKFRYGETEYGIGIVPLGGYVKMLGQDDDPRRAEQEAERIRVSEGDEESSPQLDPRSYPAKPVWQRMIIISAGVAMNVVTGVLFAAIAYGVGVSYTPAIVGGVTAGGPAWQAGVEPGGRVLSVGSLEPDEKLHFDEMRLEIMTQSMESPGQPVPVSLRYGDEVKKYLLNTQPNPAMPDLRMIGISSPRSATLSGDTAALPRSAADEVLSEADAGATITAVEGQPLDLQSSVPTAPLLDALHTRLDQPIQLQLRREDGTVHSVELPPQKAKSLGVRFAIGPVTALVQGGPADVAGVKVDDVITAIDGNEDIDAYTLAHHPITGTEPVTLTLRRGEEDQAETIEVEVTPREALQTLPPVSDLGDQIGSQSLGLAYRPLTTVRSVSASSQDASGDRLEPGDELQEAIVRWPKGRVPESLQQMLSEEAIEALSEGWEFGPRKPLTTLIDSLQILPVGTQVRLLAIRPSEERVIDTTVTVVQEEDRFWYERGLVLMPSQSVQQAESLSAAMVLGFREGKRRLGDVFRFLGMLVRGKVKAKFVGGPIRIVQMAGVQAEKGVSKQLLFLTLLSMNLAIINFLPIPALDGGHMVFLLAEAVRGKKVDEQLEMRLTLAGVLAILALMIFVFANDIIHS